MSLYPRQCRCIHIAVIVNKIMPFIIFHNPFQERQAFLCTESRRLDRILILDSIRSMFPPKEVRAVQQVIEGLQHLHVTIEVDATIVVECVEADVIGSKGPFLNCAGLLHPKYRVNVKVALVPKHELVIREFFLPALHTALDQFRVRVAAQPAVMDYLGNRHSSNLVNHHRRNPMGKAFTADFGVAEDWAVRSLDYEAGFGMLAGHAGN